MNKQLNAPSQVPHVVAKNRNFAALASLGVAGMEDMKAGSGNGYGAGSGGGVGGGVYRASDAIQEGDVSTNAFDDFFEYALTQPVTIHKNESAMVPILQQELPAEHVPAKPGEMPAVIVDISAARELGYEPVHDLKSGLATVWPEFSEAAL